MSWKWGTALLLLAGFLTGLYSCYGTRRTLLMENRVHHWKLYFVKKSNFSVGTYRHFELYYKNRPLVLPKAVTDGQRDINTFEAASIIDNRSNAFGTAVVTFEGHFTDTAGVGYRQLVTLHIRPLFNDDLQVYNPCNGATVVITP
ncbi:hypothetical protein LQ567_23675 [Niabella pedocola]|uniref:Uncharacterized protein n=1 Tax=Niabella pedocola TaxID=1752077 RepID=A0ABS8PXL9_9BACT|nr:hypothetical protein [Niabella pedocola]MCD2425804.1 hypothetical protein [Niabella pedocola]